MTGAYCDHEGRSSCTRKQVPAPESTPSAPTLSLNASDNALLDAKGTFGSPISLTQAETEYNWVTRGCGFCCHRELLSLVLYQATVA